MTKRLFLLTVLLTTFPRFVMFLLAFSLAIPIPCICVSLIYMVIAYHCIYKKRKEVCIEIIPGSHDIW